MSTDTVNVITDQSLFDQIRRGNEQAFAGLYNRYVGKLLNTAYQRVQDKDVAEEIVQELFVSLWLRREQIPALESVSGYLFTILRNRVIDHFRQQTRRAALTDVLEQDLCANQSEETVIYNDLLTTYESHIARLPDKCRAVFQLYKQGHSVQDIADTLGMGQKTVESHLLKANRTLRIQLKDFTALVVIYFFLPN